MWGQRMVGLVVGCVATMAAAAPGWAVTVKTPVANVTVNSPLLGTTITTAQTTASRLVGTTTTTLCGATSYEDLCALQILDYRWLTTYRRPDGRQFTRVTGGIVNAPTFVDATGDGLPDLTANIEAVDASDIRMTIERTPGAPPDLPVSIEALVKPGANADVVAVGYDTRDSNAPTRFEATAAVVTGDPALDKPTTVDATVATEGAGAALTVLGGMFEEVNNNIGRANASLARLRYSPVPPSADIDLSIGETAQTGTLSAVTPSVAALDVLLVDGGKSQHVTAELRPLHLPVTVNLDRVDASGQPTEAESGFTHVELRTGLDVEAADVTYEQMQSQSDGSTATARRVRAHLRQLPEEIDFRQTPTGLVVGASAPIGHVSGGIADGVVGDAINPVPTAAPVELDETSYVQNDQTGGVNSTTFGVEGLEHIKFDLVKDAEDQVEITVGAIVASQPFHVLTSTDATVAQTLQRKSNDVLIEDLPHSIRFKLAPARKRVVEFCGSSNATLFPCFTAHPQGIDRIMIKKIFDPTTLFARATTLDGLIEDVPAQLYLDMENRAPADENDPDQNTRVHVDTSKDPDDPVPVAVGRVALRATSTLPEGQARPDFPEDNGVRYTDTDELFAVVALVSGVSKVHLDTDPVLHVELVGEGGHDFSFELEEDQDDGSPGKKLVGEIRDRPARTGFSFDRREPLEISVRGKDAAGNPARTGGMTLDGVRLDPDPKSKARNVSLGLRGIPPNVDIVKTTLDDDGLTFTPPTGKKFEMSVEMTAGDKVDFAELTLKNDVPLVPDYEIQSGPPEEGATHVLTIGDAFSVYARVTDLREVKINTKDIDAFVDVATPQDFRLNIQTGMGDPPDLCGDDPEEHNPAHPEFYDVFIEDLQPKMRFRYTPLEGEGSGCDEGTGRLIQYEAGGRAKSMEFETSIGDLSNLHAALGETSPGKPRVPTKMSVCQADYEGCYDLLNRSHQVLPDGFCLRNACDSENATLTVMFDAHGERTHARIDACLLNPDIPNRYTVCNDGLPEWGVFADIDLTYFDFGFNYDDGSGFVAANTVDREGRDDGIRGWIRYYGGVDVNGNLGYDAGQPHGSRWDHRVQAFTIGPSSASGTSTCADPDYVYPFDDTSTWFALTATDQPNQLVLTDYLCPL